MHAPSELTAAFIISNIEPKESVTISAPEAANSGCGQSVINISVNAAIKAAAAFLFLIILLISFIIKNPFHAAKKDVPSGGTSF